MTTKLQNLLVKIITETATEQDFFTYTKSHKTMVTTLRNPELTSHLNRFGIHIYLDNSTTVRIDDGNPDSYRYIILLSPNGRYKVSLRN